MSNTWIDYWNVCMSGFEVYTKGEKAAFDKSVMRKYKGIGQAELEAAIDKLASVGIPRGESKLVAFYKAIDSNRNNTNTGYDKWKHDTMTALKATSDPAERWDICVDSSNDCERVRAMLNWASKLPGGVTDMRGEVRRIVGAATKGGE
jgi:hypothetical protein